MRCFYLCRDKDISGVSGEGVVAEGVEFSDGHVAIHWINTPYPTTTPHPDGVASVAYIHGHAGATRIVWDDGSGSAAAFPNLPPGSAPRVVPVGFGVEEEREGK